jgi:hypothetical protein
MFVRNDNPTEAHPTKKTALEDWIVAHKNRPEAGTLLSHNQGVAHWAEAAPEKALAIIHTFFRITWGDLNASFPTSKLKPSYETRFGAPSLILELHPRLSCK